MNKNRSLLLTMIIVVSICFIATNNPYQVYSIENDIHNEESMKIILQAPEFTSVIRTPNTNIILLSGTSDNPYSPTLAIISTRDVAIIEEYTQLGTNLISKRPLNVTSIFALSFPFMIEYLDNDDNGIFDFTPPEAGNSTVQNNYKYNDFNIKGVNLKIVNWEKSIIRKSNSITIFLNATNVPYSGFFGILRDDVVEKISISLTLTKDEINTIQEYKVPVIETKRTSTFSTTLKSPPGNKYETFRTKESIISWKINHYIEGWDFVSRNTKLFFGINSLSGEIITPSMKILSEQLFKETRVGTEFLPNNNDYGDRYYQENGTIIKNALIQEKLQFANGFRTFLTYSWLDTYETNQGTFTTDYQINRVDPILGRRITILNYDISIIGFIQQGGFNYNSDMNPNNSFILHDPKIDLSIYHPIIEEFYYQINNFLVNMNLAFFVTTTALLFIVTFSLRRKTSKRN